MAGMSATRVNPSGAASGSNAATTTSIVAITLHGRAGTDRWRTAAPKPANAATAKIPS